MPQLGCNEERAGSIPTDGNARLMFTGPSKPKNIISRSGNRMGQRQRQKLMQLALSKEKAKANSSANDAGSSKQHHRGVIAGGKPSKGATSGAPNGRMSQGHRSSKESHSNYVTRPREQYSNSYAASHNINSEKLHPSWEAKKHSQSIRAFEGTKVRFD